ncbi:hypothetical protein J6590_047409 [Homalodisca vitripennis]|nr:hypothetical protein J6590_047409 [Homalodisca vitripennis]
MFKANLKCSCTSFIGSANEVGVGRSIDQLRNDWFSSPQFNTSPSRSRLFITDKTSLLRLVVKGFPKIIEEDIKQGWWKFACVPVAQRLADT